MFVNFAESVINLILKQSIYYYHEQDCAVLLHFTNRGTLYLSHWNLYRSVANLYDSITSVSETIRKPPLVKAQNASRKQK